MGLTTRSAAGNVQGSPTQATPPLDFVAFAAEVREGLAPASLLESLAVDRLTLAAWRLRAATAGDLNAARDGGAPDLGRETRRAEQSLDAALGLLERVRGLGSTGWGRASLPASPHHTADDLDAPDHSNEWPTLPARAAATVDADGDDETEAEMPERWQDRLIFDFNVSETSPVVKGTWVTVSQVVSMIVDGSTWSDVLRAHPELTEDDIRTCLAYTVDQDDHGAY